MTMTLEACAIALMTAPIDLVETELDNAKDQARACLRAAAAAVSDEMVEAFCAEKGFVLDRYPGQTRSAIAAALLKAAEG